MKVIRRFNISDYKNNVSVVKHNNSSLLYSSVSLVTGFIIGVGTILSYGQYIGVDTSADSKLSLSVKKTYAVLKDNYDGEIDLDKLIEGANKGLVNSLGDQYTQYFSAEDAKEFQKDLSGDIGAGIGVELGVRNDRITILRTLADNPAVRAGIIAGDYIVSVDDVDVGQSNTSETAKKIRGLPGTNVKIVIERKNQLITFNLIREKINDLSVDAYIRENVGILRILRFDDGTGELAREAVKDFKSKNIKGIVIDLRNNGGGYVFSAKDVANLWLDNKILMTEKSKNKTVDTIRTGSSPIVSGIKTVILLNGSSASASEILAGAFQDYKIATIIGEKSFGKGSVQKLLDLNDGSQIKVTIAKWYTPNQKNITGEGVQPDKIVVYSPENINKGIDDQLDSAIKEINP